MRWTPTVEAPNVTRGAAKTEESPLPAVQMPKARARSSANQRCTSIEAGTMAPKPQAKPMAALPTQDPREVGTSPQTAKPAAIITRARAAPRRREKRR